MIVVEELSKTFPASGTDAAFTAVDQVSFEVPEGEFFTLLGPSGCGKTTTLRCIAGLERPDAGEIAIDGRSSSPTGVYVPRRAPRRRHGLPELRDLAAHDRVRERRVPADRWSRRS